MSTTTIRFTTTLIIGEEEVPLASELVMGDGQSEEGVENGFLFKLNRQPDDPPVTVCLGDVIGFIQNHLNGGNLADNPRMLLISQAFPDIDKNNFNASNQTLINLNEFSLNSTTSEFLFSFNLDVESADPNRGLIALPAEFSNWLQIDSLAISFSATRKSDTALP